MIEPRATTEVTPIGVVPVAARIVDDYGISRVQLRATRLSGEPLITLDVETKEPKQSTDRVELEADYVWSLEPLNLSPGDALALILLRQITGVSGMPLRSKSGRLP